ncbi:MAG: phosphatase PAP2 family protein [Tabrizicola sp.]|nr:phosphatase PAP2 family protein [Tabrizicola sp.]
MGETSTARRRPTRSPGIGSIIFGPRFGAATVDRQVAVLLGCILSAFAVFAIWPDIDLRISSAFHDPATGFIIEGHPVTEAARHAVWNLGILLCLVAVFGVAIAAAGREFLLPGRTWGFVVTLYVIGPGLMVETLMKPLWGRARPAQIAEFGGPLHFSPPNEMVNLCLQNCSFVSGEVSGATVTALTVLLFHDRVSDRLSKIASVLLLTFAWSLPLAVALQRVAAGRHFLSDAVFALLFTLLLAVALSAGLRPTQRPASDARAVQEVNPAKG